MPAHPIGHGTPYAAAVPAAASAEHAAWYANANRALSGIWQRLRARGLNAPAVRCRPLPCDLDTLVTLGADALGAEALAPTVGIGFSPGDVYYDEPYFYVSRHPAPDVATLPRLPGVGHWHADRFTAAAVGEDVAAKDREAEVDAFRKPRRGFWVGGRARLSRGEQIPVPGLSTRLGAPCPRPAMTL